MEFVKINLGIFGEFFGDPIFEVTSLKKWKMLALFCLGGLGYVGVELIWRGRSHGSMFLAGGTCFLLLGKLAKARLPLPLRCAAGALTITAVELLAGLVFNRAYGVWDYRGMPMNLAGQICLPFTLLWYPLSFAAMPLYCRLERLLEGG